MITYEQVAEAFEDSFLKPEIYHGHIQVAETKEGTVVVPECYAQYPSNAEAAKQYGVSEDDVSTVYAYAVRLSAPGYLDCTDWELVHTEQSGLERLLEMAEE